MIYRYRQTILTHKDGSGLLPGKKHAIIASLKIEAHKPVEPVIVWLSALLRIKNIKTGLSPVERSRQSVRLFPMNRIAGGRIRSCGKRSAFLNLNQHIKALDVLRSALDMPDAVMDDVVDDRGEYRSNEGGTTRRISAWSIRDNGKCVL